MRDAQFSGKLFDLPAALNERHGIFLELAVISPRIPALHFFHLRVFLLQSPSRVFEVGSQAAIKRLHLTMPFQQKTVPAS